MLQDEDGNVNKKFLHYVHFPFLFS